MAKFSIDRTQLSSAAGALLVAVAALGSAFSIITMLGTSKPRAHHAVERYLTTEDGSSIVFRVESPSQPVLRRSINIAARSAGDIVADRPESAASIIDALRPEWGGDDYELSDIVDTRILLVRTVDEQSNITTRTMSIGLLHGTKYSIVEQEFPNMRIVFAPPLTVLDSAAAIDATQEFTGVVLFPFMGANAPYTATLALQEKRAVDLGSERLEDCLIVLTTLRIGAINFGDSQSTYCAGSGEVAFESRTAEDVLLNRGSAVRISSYDRTFTDADEIAARDVRASTRPELEPRAAWVYTHSERISSIYAAPTIDRDSVFVGNYFGEIVALDRTDGALRWRFQTGGPLFAAPVVAGDTLLAGSADRKLYAVHAADGAFLWSFSTPDAIIASPAVSGSIAYVGSEDGTIFAVDIASGALLHSFSTGGAIAAAPVPYGDVLYVASESGALFALDADDLSMRWAFAASAPLSTGPLVTSDAVYFGDHENIIYAVSTNPTNRNGSRLWSKQIRSDLQGSLIFTNNMVIATTDDRIHALEAASGTLRWSTDKNSFYGSATVNGDHLHVSTKQGIAMYALTNGRLLLTHPISDGSRPSAVRASEGWLYVGNARGDVKIFAASAK